MSGVWKKCSICKKDILQGADYYLCSVSTCRSKRKGFTFCSINCWDAHLGFANHREAYAEEAKAPMHTAATELNEEKPREKRRIIVDGTQPRASAVPSAPSNLETLVVVSRVKNFVKNQADFNTSQCAIDALTKKIAEECLKGIKQAEIAGRKTMMGRDIK